MTAPAAEQVARRQFLFREINERISELSTLVGREGAKLFVCECSREECVDPLELTVPQYENVRADGGRFVVVDGHELDEVERVVERHARYIVVEKFGEAGELARSEDPRRLSAS